MDIWKKTKSVVNDSDFRFILKIFSVWWIFLFITSIFIQSYLNQSSGISQNVLKTYSNWDGSNFLNIAENGYYRSNLTVFFPLYPLVISTLSKIIPISQTLVGLIVNGLFFMISLVVLFKLVKKDFNQQIATKTIYLLAIFPTSFFFATTYSESLFLLLTVLTFYFLKSKNSSYLSIVLSLLASLTRFVGIIVALTVIYSFFKHKNHMKFYSLFSLAGIVGYMFFLYFHFGNGLVFITSESEWGRTAALPVISIWNAILFLSKFGLNSEQLPIIFDLIFTTFGLGLALRSIKKLPSEYGYFALGSIALPLFTSNLVSIPRFLIVIFPLFITLATINSKTLSKVYILLSISLLIFFWIRFNLGLWVS